MVTLYYLLALNYKPRFDSGERSRADLEAFNERRKENRVVAEGDVAHADYSLLEFDRYAQSPNDAVALNYRFEVIERFLDLPGH
jgi:hypothetical protein